MPAVEQNGVRQSHRAWWTASLLMLPLLAFAAVVVAILLGLI